MNVSIIGIGYVGSVSMACLAKLGHEIVGVDVSQDKIDSVNSGIPPVQEPNLDRIFLEAYRSGKISATLNLEKALKKSDACIICVGTPNGEDNLLDVRIIEKICIDIAHCLNSRESIFPIIIRSTVNPGTSLKLEKLIHNETGLLPNTDFCVLHMPEFLREGSAIEDFFNPPYILVGQTGKSSIKETIFKLNKGIDSEVFFVDSRTSELIKFVNNSFHALKVSFANEIGLLAKSLGIDSHEFMDIFCKDKKLNISPYYFKPAFAYGGSCLPKDLLATNSLGIANGLSLPLLSSISSSNEMIINTLIERIKKSKINSIGIIGLAFKKGTDDLRNSPILKIIRELLDNSYSIRIFENFKISSLVGQNKKILFDIIPEINNLITEDIDTVIEESKMIVCFNDNSFLKSRENVLNSKTIIDLTVKKYDNISSLNYEGLTY